MSHDEEDYDARPAPRDVVRSFGRVLFEDGWAPEPLRYVPIDEHERVVSDVVRALTASPPRSTVLVGESGVGKSVVMREAGRRLHADGWLVFEATAADVGAHQSYIGMLEGRLQELASACEGENVLWLMPDLPAALTTGAYRENPRGVLEFMLPYVERGALRVLGDAGADAWTVVSQSQPRARRVFNEIRVAPLGRTRTDRLVRDWLAAAGVDVSAATLDEAFELADEFLPGRAAPGHLMRLVAAALAPAAAEGALPDALTSDALLAALARETGLPRELLDGRARLDLDQVRDFFATRVLGQPEAVELLVERVAMIKAGLTDPTRPLGVLFFAGPTGTGKTELTKVLAEYLFGSQDRLVRLDMSEYQSPDSLDRLLAPAGAQESSGLIAAVRRQPFSVVLLDEFEKAHPQIWDAFLQVFDDGRLTDRAGKTADFRHCVVIMTSNLGAGASRRGPLGFSADGTAGARPGTSVDRALAAAFRPEFVNRIDRVVAFRPLDRDVMRSLVRKELDDVSGRRGLRTRPWAVEWDATAVEFLLEQGFTPDLGARPLKRAVEEHVLAPLARTIVEREVPHGDQFLFVRSRGREMEVQFIDPDAPDDPPPEGAPARAGELGLRGLAREPAGTRAEVEHLTAELERIRAAVRDEAVVGRKRRALELIADDAFWESPERFRVLAQAELADRLDAGVGTAERLADRLRRASATGSARLVHLLAQRLYLIERALEDLDGAALHDAFVLVRPGKDDDGSRAFAARIAGMYRQWAAERGMRLRELRPSGEAAAGQVVLAVSGFAAYSILRDEAGLHLLEKPDGDRKFARVPVHVQVAARPLEPVEGVAELTAQAEGALGGVPVSTTVVRRYREQPSPLVRDGVRNWRTGRVDRVLGGDFDLF